MARPRRAGTALRERFVHLGPAFFRPAASAAIWLAAAGLLLAAWVAGVPRLRERAPQCSLASGVQARFAEAPPPWAQGELASGLLATARARLSPDPLRREDLVAVREALLETGWFKGIDQVTRVHPDLVEIAARFAEPFAVVRDAGQRRDRLLDAAGRFLPRVYPAGSSPFAAIVGSFSELEEIPAEAWAAQEVRAGLDLLRLLRDRSWHEQIREVCLARDPATGQLSLRLKTDRGCEIFWGRPPGQEQASEVPARRKLEYLDYHQSRFGHIDRGFLREMDITGDVVTGR